MSKPIFKTRKPIGVFSSRLAAAIAAKVPILSVVPAESSDRNDDFLRRKENYQGHARPAMACRVQVSTYNSATEQWHHSTGIFPAGGPNQKLKMDRETFTDDTSTTRRY